LITGQNTSGVSIGRKGILTITKDAAPSKIKIVVKNESDSIISQKEITLYKSKLLVTKSIAIADGYSTLSLKLDNQELINSGKITLSFDKNKISLVDAIFGQSLLNNNHNISINNDTGAINIEFSSLQAILVGLVDLVHLRCQIKGASTSTPISIASTDFKSEISPVTLVGIFNGRIISDKNMEFYR
jgi:hypothetical protein